MSVRRLCLKGAAAWAVGALAGPAARAEQLRPWPAGRKAPALTLPTLDGPVWDLAAQRGRPVLLNFWASWCEPCREEMASLELAAERHKADGLVVATVNYQEAPRTIRAFVQASDLALPVLLDADGAATTAWTPKMFPTSVLLWADGQPWQQVVGAVDWGSPAARGWLKQLVAGRRVKGLAGRG